MMGETRQQPPRDFATEMCELENETIASIYELCLKHRKNPILTAAVFVSHVISTITLIKNEKEAEGEA